MSCVKLVFLGTGSGKPLPGRGVSCVALFRDGEMFLFDCGEGTQVQLARSSMRPGTLEAILLTHFHGDHVNGLPGLLGTLTLNQREGGLPLVAPRGLRQWFKALRSTGILNPGFPLDFQEVSGPGKILEGDGWHIEAQRLKHRVPCWGYAFVEVARPGRFDLERARELGVPPGPLYGKLQRGESVTFETPDAETHTVRPEQVLGPARPGLRIAYCCDTVPCDGALALARDADVLIHESTYLAGDEKMAHQRGHSTAADAARCAKEAGVHTLILTHFSQKHPRNEPFLDDARKIFPNTFAAQDLFEFEVKRREA